MHISHLLILNYSFSIILFKFIILKLYLLSLIKILYCFYINSPILLNKNIYLRLLENNLLIMTIKIIIIFVIFAKFIYIILIFINYRFLIYCLFYSKYNQYLLNYNLVYMLIIIYAKLKFQLSFLFQNLWQFMKDI